MPKRPFFRKHDGWWVVQLRQGNRRWQHKLIKGTPPRGKDTEQQAYQLFNQLMADAGSAMPAPDKVRMTDLLRAFLEFSSVNHRPNTFKWYKFYLVSFDEMYGQLRPFQVTPEIVQAWLRTEKGWKGSCRGAIMALKRVLRWGCDNRKIQSNPLHALRIPPSRRRERFLTQDERKQIYDYYKEGDPFRSFLYAMEQTGCRPGEISEVAASMVDLRTGVWNFDEHKTVGKTGERRVVILTPAMVELTKRLMTMHPEGPLFRNEDGNPWNRNSIRCRFRRVREALNLDEDLVAYLYRHAVCTDLLEAGVGLVQTCEILGHRGTTMVMKHYSKIRERRDHLREEIMKARGPKNSQ